MRLASCLLSALCFAAFCRLAHATPAEFLPFQEIPELPTRSSLTLGNTHYDPPEELLALPFFSGAVALDNFGSHDDEGRFASALNLRGLLGDNDLLSLRSMGTAEEGHYHWGAYQRDVGPWNTRLGVTYSDLAYELGDELEILAAKGTTRTSSAFILQPLLRTERLNLKAQLQYDDKRMDDEVGVLYLHSDKRSRVFDYGLAATLRDQRQGAAATHLTLNWSEGNLNIDGSPYTLVGRAEPGRFNVLRASLARLQPLAERLTLYARAEGQWSNDRLDDSEKIYIGGVFGTRSTYQTAAYGDKGWMTTLELRYALSQTWQLVTFADHGQARLNTPSLTNGTAPQRLSAAGVGAKWSTRNWHLSTLAAWELGDHKAQDDIEHQPRVWAQVAYIF